VRMRLRWGCTMWIGFGVPVPASAFPVTITALAAFTAFAMMISRRDIVHMSLRGVVGGPGIVPMDVRFGVLIGIWLSVSEKIWSRIPMDIQISPPVAGTLIPSSIAVTGSPMMTSFMVALAPTPRI